MKLLGVGTVTRLRYADSTVVAHKFVRGQETSARIQATFAPASSRTMKRAPNGVSVTDMVDYVTYSEVRAAVEGGHPADRLKDKCGVTYEPLWVIRQPPFLGEPEHWEGAALKLQNLEGPGS